MSSILITGGAGLLATNWATRISEFNSVSLGIHNRKITLPNIHSIVVDLESVTQIRRILDQLAIDTVIHTVGVSSIEICEKMPEFAEHINVVLANNVAQAAREHGARLVHISTDQLFDGASPMRTEDDFARMDCWIRWQRRIRSRVGSPGFPVGFLNLLQSFSAQYLLMSSWSLNTSS